MDTKVTQKTTRFQYNICTCGAQALALVFVSLLDFNTTFVHVEQTTSDEISAYLKFQYNICTCGADIRNPYFTDDFKFQYNICTCGAESKLKKEARI